MVHRELRAHPRQDMEGLAAVRMNFEATALLYRGKASTPQAREILKEAHELWGGRPTPRELASLAHIMTGGPRTQQRLARAGMRPSALAQTGLKSTNHER